MIADRISTWVLFPKDVPPRASVAELNHDALEGRFVGSLMDIMDHLPANDDGSVTYWPAYYLWKPFQGNFKMTLGLTTFQPYSIGHAIYIIRAYCLYLEELVTEFHETEDHMKWKPGSVAQLAKFELEVQNLRNPHYLLYSVAVNDLVESMLQTLYATYPTFALDLMASYPARLLLSHNTLLDRYSPFWMHYSSGSFQQVQATTQPIPIFTQSNRCTKVTGDSLLHFRCGSGQQRRLLDRLHLGVQPT